MILKMLMITILLLTLTNCSTKKLCYNPKLKTVKIEKLKKIKAKNTKNGKLLSNSDFRYIVKELSTTYQKLKFLNKEIELYNNAIKQ